MNAMNTVTTKLQRIGDKVCLLGIYFMLIAAMAIMGSPK